MFNLLPDHLKEKIKSEYNIRRIIVVFIFLIFIGAVSLVFMFPSWIVSFYKEKDISSQVESTQSSLEADVATFAATIKQINAELKTIDTTLAYKKVIPVINTVLSQKTSSIQINGINFESDDSATASVFIEGVSATRGALLAFVKSLEETKSFKTVDLPISNFAKEKNISFSLNLKIGK